MNDRPWWDEWPAVRQREFEAFAANGISVTNVREHHGVLSVDLAVPVLGHGEIDLTATYPDTYPFFRPVVQLRGDGPDLRRHAHPFGRNLCLLARRLDAWWPTDVLADVLVQQLPKVIETGLGTRGSDPADEEIRALEEIQAEPFSEYYTCYAPGAILLDSAWQPGAGDGRGRMQISLGSAALGSLGDVVVGTVSRVDDEDGRVLHSFGIDPIHAEVTLTVPWVRLSDPVIANTPEEIAAELETLYPRLLQDAHSAQRVGRNERVQMVAVGFPEEREHRDARVATGWLFLMRRRTLPAEAKRRKAHARSGSATPPAQVTAIRAAYVGRADLAARGPELHALAGKHIAIFGLGAVGGFITEHLARSGVGTLTLVDHDRFDPATLPRHAATIEHSGWPKVAALTEVVGRCNPHVKVRPWLHHLGRVRVDGSTPSEHQTLGEILDGVDMIIDATAAVTPAFVLGALAAERRIPFIVASSTGGAWGGRVVRIRPDETEGCYSCLMALVVAEETAETFEQRFVPPARPDDRIQPVACGEPTFTGAGVDVAEVSLFTVRLVFATIQTGREGSYPDFRDDVFVLALRDDTGRPIPPNWVGSPLPRVDNCVGHASLTA